MSATFWQNLYGIYRDLHVPGGIQWDESLHTWVVTGPDSVNAVLRSPHVSASWDLVGPTDAVKAAFPELHRVICGWLILMDPPGHRQLRSLMQPAFSPRRLGQISSFEPRVERLIQSLNGHAEVDLISAYARPLASHFLAELMLMPESVVTAAARQLTPIGSFLSAPHNLAFAEQADSAARSLCALFTECVADLPDDSPLRGLMETGPAYPGERYLHSTLLLLFAGLETTVTLISLGLIHLMEDRQAYQAVSAREISPEAAVEALLRLDAPVPQTPRVALADLSVAGQTIKAGDRILVILGAANRDWDRGEDGDELRFDDPGHVAFGAGIHYCLGAPLARRGATAAISGWTAAFPDARPGSDGVRWARGIGYRRVEQALIRLR